MMLCLLYFIHKQVEDVLGPDTGYYYCRYNDSTSFSNDKEREDSVYVFVYGKVFYSF